MKSITDYASINIESAFEEARLGVQTIRQRRAEAPRPPVSNTGGNSTQLATLDTLTFTVPVPSLTFSPLAVVLCDPDTIAEVVASTFLAPLGFGVGLSTGRRINGYSDSCPIVIPGDDGSNGAVNLGYVAMGGNRNKNGDETCCVYLTGQACESVNLLDADGGRVWAGLADKLRAHDAKITRLDAAFDDLDGLFGGIGAAVGWYESGAFQSAKGGVQPSVCQHGDWIHGHGRTLEVGKRENGKMLRIYEKGHQLGAEHSPWVRYELELRSRDRVIPYDALTDPTGILAGSSPALEMMLSKAVPRPVKTVVKQRLRVTMDHLVHHARIAYGRLVNAMEGVGMDPAVILDSLRVSGLPRRLYVPPALYVQPAGAPS